MKRFNNILNEVKCENNNLTPDNWREIYKQLYSAIYRNRGSRRDKEDLIKEHLYQWGIKDSTTIQRVIKKILD